MPRLRAFVASYWTPAGRRALANLAGLTAGQALAQGSAFAALLVLTTGLGPAGFGAYVFGANVLAYLAILGGLGLGNAVVREVTEHPEAADASATAYIAGVAAASLAVGLLLVVAALLAPVSPDERLVLVLVGLAALPLNLTLTPLFDAHHRQALSAALAVPADVLHLGGVAWLASAGQLTVPAAGVLLLGKWLVAATAGTVGYHVFVRRFRWQWDRGRAGRLLRTGLPLMGATIVWMVPLQGGVLYARWAGGPAAAAVYGLAYQLAAPCLLVSFLVLRIVRPHVTGPHGRTRGFVVRLAAFGAAAMAAAWAGSAALGLAAIHLVLDPAVYGASVAPMLLLATAFVVFATNGALDSYLLAAGRPRAVLAAYALGAVVFVGAVAVQRPEPVAVAAASLAAAVGTALALAAFLVTRRGRLSGSGPATAAR